jgi:hypothetical protein
MVGLAAEKRLGEIRISGAHLQNIPDFIRASKPDVQLDLVYRSWHGMHFKLGKQSGRFGLPAEDLIDQTLGPGFSK